MSFRTGVTAGARNSAGPYLESTAILTGWALDGPRPMAYTNGPSCPSIVWTSSGQPATLVPGASPVRDPRPPRYRRRMSALAQAGAPLPGGAAHSLCLLGLPAKATAG